MYCDCWLTIEGDLIMTVVALLCLALLWSWGEVDNLQLLGHYLSNHHLYLLMRRPSSARG